MPFCPRCRAEYRAGLRWCSKCDVGLLETLPAAAPALSPFVEYVLRQARRQAQLCVKAWHGVARASLAGLRAILRKRALAWLVVAAVCLSTLANVGGEVVAYNVTARGREIRAQVRRQPRLTAPHGQGFHWSYLVPVIPLREFNGWIGGLQRLEGALLPVAVYILPSSGQVEYWRAQLRLAPLLTTMALLLAILSACWNAGMLASIRGQLRIESKSLRSTFLQGVAAHWLPLTGLQWILVGFYEGLFLLTTIPATSNLLNGALVHYYWRFAPVLLMLLAVSPAVVVADRAGLRRAIGQSAQFMLSHWRGAIMLLVLLAFLRLLARAPWVLWFSYGPQLHSSDPLALALRLSVDNAFLGLGLGLLSLWFSATLMAWYIAEQHRR